jgi:hypothetical protein
VSGSSSTMRTLRGKADIGLPSKKGLACLRFLCWPVLIVFGG